MNQHIYTTVNTALNLRVPQKESLEILAAIADILPLNMEHDMPALLEAVQNKYPDVESFERDFPSLCFAVATGVGKTRLMGAFIAYLYLAKGIKHFFILAPNLTIHEKLVADFTPNTPKYVFEGLTEFSINQPLILTGDNFDRISSHLADERTVQINIFNISKINSEERNIKKMSEYLGESYFAYLSGLDDLVVLMDEAHRYRAKAGMKAIDELKPVLGIELTATPQVESGSKSVAFKNVIYNYPLHFAMDDGYVKEPAVATRENFDVSKYTDLELLDQLKLTDGVHIHENVKVELEAYAKNSVKKLVKPFMLVVCKDTTHADNIMEFIRSDDFFEGAYKEKAIIVHSSQKGEEKDETVERLLAVEDPNEPTEIVVHVNMLKEGWDVTNLYTIVPLRAANSRTLVEQSIGRGLRLPYGERTGNTYVDRLTIVAHDKFDEIIKEASSGKSIIRTSVIVGRDISEKRKKVVDAKPVMAETIKEEIKPTDQPVIEATFAVIKEYETLPSSNKLKDAKTKKEITKRVIEKIKMSSPSAQMDELTGNDDSEKIAAVVESMLDIFVQHTIDIPKVVLVPKSDTAAYHYLDFEPDMARIQNYKPVPNKILVEHLHSRERDLLEGDAMNYEYERPEDYIMSELVILTQKGGGYSRNKAVINSLAVKVINFMEPRLKEDLVNVLQFYGRQIGQEIYNQMSHHIEYETTEYDVQITSGFTTPKACTFTANEDAVFFKDEMEAKRLIRGMLFKGFKKCLYPVQKFDSDTERLFSVILENDSDVEKWYKPVLGDFQIFYRDGITEGHYNPDFVVETATDRYVCEMKGGGQTQESKVLAKKEAAEQWCINATDHALKFGGKPWHYVLVPHDKLKLNATLKVVAEKWGK